MTTFDSTHVLRTALLLGLALGVHGVTACGGSPTSAAGGPVPDASFYVPVGGAGGLGATGTGGAPGSTGGSTTATGGTTGSGGTAGTAGAGGAAGTGATSGDGGPATGSGGGTGDAAVCVVPTTLLDASKLPACDTTKFPGCTNGKCLTAAAIPAASQAQLGDCNATDKCVPTYFIERNAKFIAPTCTSVNGAEGRCLSQCIPQISSQATLLPKASCADGDLCAPCYDPRTGKDTGACTQGCDTGPTQPPKPFTKCCSGNGSCVPTSIVPAADLSLLGKDTCTGSGDLCAPDKLSDVSVKPAVCTSLSGAEGRCIADCVPNVAAQASRLPKATCGTGELCAPCYDPLSGTATGACSINGDQPTKPAVVFDKCCNDLGHCVPTTALSTAQQGQLAKDTCTASSDLCAPDVFAVVGDTAPTCRALGSLNAEGRCVPTCVPSVQAQKARLDQGTPATCPTNTLCAPCYDPVSGADTSACSQNGDSPREAKKVFPTCCGGAGACVPTALVPAAQVSQLGTDVCTGTGVLCAPKAFADPTVKPTACSAPGNIEARCLPSCLPSIQAQASSLRQQTCATNELCADCYNPLDGTDTGACEINGDTPAQAPKLFATCGGGRGLCVPTTLVPATQQTALPVDTCTEPGSLCAPAEKAKNINYKFPSCAPQILPLPKDPSQPAVCLPKYIITFQAKTNSNAGLLGQSTCQSDEICAPCVDPISKKSTGACD